MADRFSEFQSSEESEEVRSVASVDKGKSDEEQHVHLPPQEGSIATGGDTGTHTEQLQNTIENLNSFSGEHEHNRLGDTAYSTSDSESDENNRDLVILECDDELVGQLATSSCHTCQEIIVVQQQKLQLELELGRRLFLEDKQKRNEKVFLSSRAHTNEQIKSCSASGASYDFSGMEGRLLNRAGLLQEPVQLAEDIFIGQPGDKISTEVCLGLLECLLTSRHVSSEVQPSATGEMSNSTHTAYLDDEKQLACNNSMLSSPGSMSSLNSYPTSPSDEACQMPVFLTNMSVSLSKAAAEPCDETKDPNNDGSCMIGNTSVACAVCSELPLTLQEKLSNQFVGDNCVRDSSAIRSNHECVSSGENNQDTETGDLMQLEDGTQLSKEEILILKSEVEFCQNQCHELRQQLGQLKEQFQQCEEEKQQLELELGRRSFLKDKQKRYEKAFLSSRAHANQLGGAGLLQDPGFSRQQRLLEISNSLSDVELRQMKFLAKRSVNAFRLAKIRNVFELFEELDANGVLSCTYVRKLLKGIQRFDLLEKLDAPLLGNGETADGAFYMDEDSVQEPRAYSTNPKILDLATEEISPRNHNLDTLPENPPQLSSANNVLELPSSDWDPVTETRETETCMSEDQNGLLATAAECESQEHIHQLEEESQKCGTENRIPRDEFKTNSSYEGLQSPNGQKMLDAITEPHPVIPPRDYNLDLLSERQGGCSESLTGVHMQSNEGDHRVSGANKADSGSNMSCGNSDNCGSGMNAVCDVSQRQPTDKWMRFGARPKTHPVKSAPPDPSMVESLTCGLPDTVHVPVGSSESGINKEFLVRHSRDRSLLESLRHSSVENELTGDASLPGASYMESMMNYIEADRIRPHTVDDEVASRPDEHTCNRLIFPLLCAVGGSTFEESLDGTTGPDCTQNSDHLPNTSIGNMAHSAAGPYSAGRSNGALNGVLSETESTSAHLDAPGDASSACNSVDPAGHQVAVVSEPCRTDSANSRDSMSDRNTDCNGINALLLILAQHIQVFAASGERQIEEEQRREARVRAWNSNRFLGQAEDCLTEALDSTSNSAMARARREAVIRALTEEMRRGPSSCSEPVEHSCVCLENDGSQGCTVYGIIVPETCQPDSAHDQCCKCLQDVFVGSIILPCSHRVHTECLVSMIQNGELSCPICHLAFLLSD